MKLIDRMKTFRKQVLVSKVPTDAAELRALRREWKLVMNMMPCLEPRSILIQVRNGRSKIIRGSLG